MHQAPLGTGSTGLIAAVLLAAAAHYHDTDPTASPRPLGTILIVDDDSGLRELLVKLLTSFGYTAFAVRLGSEALTFAECHPEPIDLLLTDIVMPGMSGFELTGAFLELHPEAKVLYMSGHAYDMPDIGKAVQGNPEAFLLKPFWVEQLIERIQRILPGPGPGPS